MCIRDRQKGHKHRKYYDEGYAITLAFFANLIFNLGIVFAVADPHLQKPVVTGFLILAIGIFSDLAHDRLL